MTSFRTLSAASALALTLAAPVLGQAAPLQRTPGQSTTAYGATSQADKKGWAEQEADRLAKARQDVPAKNLLAAVCASITGAVRDEPVCKAPEKLSEDDAWLILNEACGAPGVGMTQPCADFRQRRGGVLVFNFKTNDWTAWWEKSSYPLKFDVTGAPTLRLKARDARPLKILVENISPLAYSASPGVPKEEDLAIVAGLKSFLALAGTGIQGLVQTITFSAAAGVPGDAWILPGATKSIAPKVDKDKVVECVIASPKVGAIAAHVTARLEQLVRLGVKTSALEKELDALDKAKTGFIAVAQRAEDGRPVTASDLVGPETAALEAAYNEFDAAVRELADASDSLVSCQPLLGGYATLIGAPADGTVINALATRIADIKGCSDTAVTALANAVRDNALLLSNTIITNPAVCTPAKLKPIIETHRDAMKPMVDRLFNAKQVEEKVWTAIDKAKAGRKEVFAGASVLTRQVERGLRHTWRGPLIRALIVTRQNPELSWNKVQSHEIIMKADSPYVKDLSLSRSAEEKRAYKIESAAGQLVGYGVGLIYTPLHESTYTAVTVPGGTTKVIAETKKETRAGDLAAFLTYRFMEHSPAKRRVQPVLDFGVGLTSDRPAFFVGIGAEIFRAGRIGFGWAPQRVSVLAEGQTPGVTVVSTTDDIKTVKRFDTSNYYVSFTFALDSLSLFNSK